MATTVRRPQLQTFTLGGERFTAVTMTPGDLAVLDIQHLDLPEDRTGMQGLRGWDIYDGAGTHIGRVISRSTVMCAEWFDGVDQDWLMAEYGCRRLERGVAQIVSLRDDITRERAVFCAQRAEREQRADYAAYLQRNGLELDEDGDERYAGAGSASSVPTFGDTFNR